MGEVREIPRTERGTKEDVGSKDQGNSIDK